MQRWIMLGLASAAVGCTSPSRDFITGRNLPADAATPDGTNTDATSETSLTADGNNTADHTTDATSETANATRGNSGSSAPDAGGCAPDEVEKCWEYPDGTPFEESAARAIGNCRPGAKACEGGQWGACVGAVPPEESDSCDVPLSDDNCNGSPNDGCACVAGKTRECGTDVGPCAKGVQTCGDDGTWMAQCVGGTQPAAKDSCAVEGDDANCDGVANSDCECVGDAVEPCNACGQRSCNPETGKWGRCVPVGEARCNEERTAIELCDDTGNWKAQHCTNPDATNCATACVSTDGVPSCVTSAIDGDGDGYFSAACAAAPGDDCDDTTPAVSPGSPELCDGRDNDCDGFTDILDSTVRLAGSSTRITYGTASDLRRIDITWHGSEFFFLLDGRSRTDTDPAYTSIYSGHARTNGGVAVHREMLASDHSTVLYDTPRVASVSGTLGSVVRRDGRGYGADFLTLNPDGTTVAGAATSGHRTGDITASDSSFTTLTLGYSAPSFHFATGFTDGSLGAPATRDDISGRVRDVRIAQVGSVTGALYTDSSAAQPSINLMRWFSGSILGPTQLAQPAQSGDITALASDRFALAWATPAGFRLQVRATNGTTLVCDSGEIAFGNGTLDPLDGVAVAESKLGIVVAVTDGAGNQASVFLFDEHCSQSMQGGKALSSFQSYEHPHGPRIAVGGSHIAFAWTVEGSGGAYNSYVRVMPEALCE